MNTSPTIALLAEALSKAQAEMENARKDSANPFFKSKYADLASVWEACRGPLGKYGLAVCQMPETGDQSGIIVTTVLMHSSGEWLASQLRMVPMKDDPQGIGSAITYARRYALAAAVGIAPEDDDGNSASGKSGSPETATTSTRVFTRPKSNVAVAVGSAIADAIHAAIPMPPPPVSAIAAMNAIVDPQPEYIDRGMQVNFATTFRESLPSGFQGDAEELRHQWLAGRNFIDVNGNPSSKMIPKKDFVVIRQMAAQWAKEYK